jgi:hypothetical protein
MTEAKIDRDSTPAQDADDRDYEAPEIATLGTIGEMTSANEISHPDSV